ncbi:putative DNA-binding protein with PD1-like motif [Sphingomonas kyeonggiensis]|uniref:Putative DNA-binding protein with PD1-like motif n=1 Tax=Sphingomonas kyeonggiensis TaxID=1268553 RepID=A0A7W7K5B2_9SPHN|nr:PPC domain-containing DNA-binding protein [Sphingomonas kyeonggiensis]MBB4840898.1 putative DNA-binding protein with PD1-like motif [Sphingomonas kyeonggiensis]
MSEPKRVVPVPGGFLMVLRQGDDVFEHLESLMIEADIPAASIRGFGFAGSIRFGFFDFGRRDYDPRDFTDVEVTGLTGTLAWKDGKPAVHAHATAAGRDFQAVGGHLLGLAVGRGSIEMTITVHDQRLERHFEEDIGANVLRL